MNTRSRLQTKIGRPRRSARVCYIDGRHDDIEAMTARMMRAGVGLSTGADTAHAAAEAARRAVSGFGEDPADFAVVFATAEHAADLPLLLAGVERATGTPYVAGCSAAGVIASGREVEEGPALGVLAVRSDSIRSTPFLFRDAGDQGLTAALRIGQRLSGSKNSGDVVLVWPDPFQVRPDRLLQGLDATLGPVPVAGGAASTANGTSGTFQFSGSEASSGAVSGIRLGGSFRHVVAVTQGCRPLGGPMRVTSAHENILLEVDGMPAFEALRRRLPPDLLELDPVDALASVAIALLPDPDESILRPGEYLVRNIVAVDPDTGVLAVATEVEEGQSILYAVREPDAARIDAESMLRRVAAVAPDGGFRFGLYFDCLARGRALYGRDGVDAALIARHLPGVPVLGFFCNAEIAPLRGANHLLTYTGVLVLFSE
jgi:small ligand-binding sensory domain FIST